MSQTLYYSSTAVSMSLSVGIGTGDTTCTLSAATGLPASFPFKMLIDWGTAEQEVVYVTALAGLVATIQRAKDGTAAQTHSPGAAVVHGVSAEEFNNPNIHIGASSGVHGLTGSVVGTTDTQPLTNKTVNLASNTLSGTTAQFNAALSDNDFATLAGTEVLSNKTIDTASSNALKVNGNALTATSGTATLTLPNTTDTLVGRATTDTLTNKTINGGVIDGTTTLGGVTGTVIAAKPNGYVAAACLTATSTQNVTANTYSAINGSVSVDNGTPATQNLAVTFTAVAGKRYRITLSGGLNGSVATVGGYQIQMPTNPGGTLRGATQANTYVENASNNFVISSVATFYCATGGSCTVGGYIKNSTTNGNLNAVQDTQILVEEMA